MEENYIEETQEGAVSKPPELVPERNKANICSYNEEREFVKIKTTSHCFTLLSDVYKAPGRVQKILLCPPYTQASLCTSYTQE